MNKFVIDTLFVTLIFGRTLIYLVTLVALPISFLTGDFALFGYFIFAFIVFCIPALPIYIASCYQRCPECNNRIILLPKTGRRPEFVKSTSFWYSTWGELLGIMESGNLPCHHCGEIHEYKKID